MIILLLFLLVFLVAKFGLKLYNTIVPLRAAIREAESNIKVVFKKRDTLFATILAQTASFGQYERELIVKISEDMRALGQGLTVNRLRDAYPQLLWNERITEQLSRLSELETELQVEIANYNYRVKQLNETLRSFPAIVYSRFFGWREESYFSV